MEGVLIVIAICGFFGLMVWDCVASDGVYTMCKVNAGKGTFRGAYCSSLVTPSGFALEARCKRLKTALRANLKY